MSVERNRFTFAPRIAATTACLGLLLLSPACPPALADQASSTGDGGGTVASKALEGRSSAAQADSSTEAQDAGKAGSGTSESGSGTSESGAQLKAGDFTYTVNAAGGAVVVKYEGSEASLTVPSTLGGKTVVEIGHDAFRNDTALKAVSIPDTVAVIGERAFAGCVSLSWVQLPSGLETLEGTAFYACDQLLGITLPASLKTVTLVDVSGTMCGPFGACDNLDTVAFADGTVSVPANVMAGCTAKRVNLAIPRSVATIDPGVLGSQWTSVVGRPGSAAETFANTYGLEFVDSTVYATSVSLSTTDLWLRRGESSRITYTVTPSNFDAALTWYSADPSVASVSSDGTVTTPGGLGGTTVAITDGKSTWYCAVHVWQPVTAISLNRANIEMEAGDVRQLAAACLPSDASSQSVTWSSSNPSVASVNSRTGYVTGVSQGTAVITATATDGSGVTNSCTVMVTSSNYTVYYPTAVATPHPYSNSCGDAWVYTLAGASRIGVSFDYRTAVENTYDWIYVYDYQGQIVGRYTGTELAGQTIYIDGDTVCVQIKSDGVQNDWGFAVTSVWNATPQGWTVSNGATYYYVDGSPYRGELRVDGQWYYFNANTGAMVTGLATLPNGKTCYYNANGARVTGFVSLPDGTRRYFWPETGEMLDPGDSRIPVGFGSMGSTASGSEADEGTAGDATGGESVGSTGNGSTGNGSTGADEGAEDAIDLADADDFAAVSKALNTFAAGYAGTEYDADKTDDVAQSEALAWLGIAEALRAPGADPAEPLGNGSGTGSSVGFGSTFTARIDASRVATVVKDLLGVDLDLADLASAELYYDGAYIYFDETAPGYTSENAVLFATSVAELEDGAYEVAFEEYGKKGAAAEAVSDNDDAVFSANDADELMGLLGVSSPTGRTGKAVLKVAETSGGALEVTVVSFEIEG